MTNDPSQLLDGLDLGHLALFVGTRWNDVVLSRLQAEGFSDLRVAHGYVFQHLVDGGRSISELAERMGVTQQAASKRIAELVQQGYLELQPTPDGRVKQVILSKRGLSVLRLGRRARSALQKRLTRGLDPRAVEATRGTLAALLVALGGADAVRGRRVRDPQDPTPAPRARSAGQGSDLPKRRR